MSKLLVVAKREYRETVRKKSFVIVTVLMPLLFAGFILSLTRIISSSLGTRHLLVVDATRVLGETIRASLSASGRGDASGLDGRDPLVRVDVEASDHPDGDPGAAVERLRDTELDAILVIEKGALDGSGRATLYSRSATDLVTAGLVGSALNGAATQARVRALGVAADDASRLVEKVELDTVQVTKAGGERAGGGKGDFFLAFAFAMLMLIPTLLHGREIMGGVIQEKTDRIVESLVSSMDAFDLLTGKVLGIAGVGLTQIAIWLALGAVLSVAGAGPLMALAPGALSFVTPAKLGFFVLFFLLGYLIYACVFAAGGACVNSEKEAQQALMPVTFFLLVPWFFLQVILLGPDSKIATAISLVPVWTPLTMFVRIVVGEPPLWQVALSIVLTLLSIVLLFWLAARIFRVGILWYGQRPSLPEFLRWVRRP